jgi:hypothetical protein
MLKYQTWYALEWIVILALYGLGLSSLNTALCFPLLAFFVVTIIASVLMAIVSKKVPLLEIEYVKGRRPIVTALICIGFIADWAYQGTLPIFNTYSGYITGVSEDQLTGIPVLHVVLIGSAIYWGMYMGYIFICNPKKKEYLLEFCIIILLFIINVSRGYIVYTLFVPLICFAAFRNQGLRRTKVSSVLAIIICGIGIIFLISAMGNMRYGYAWYDCSYIERIGRYVNYPVWLSKHFMWFYSYVTSPLANLNLNAIMPIDQIDVLGYLYAFLPSIFTYNYSKIATYYIVHYFNAATGFVTFLRSGGIGGLYLSIAGIFAYYSAVRRILCKYKALEMFGNAVLSLLIIGLVFYNSLRTAALCYLPILLILHSILISKQVASGKITVRFYGMKNTNKEIES